VFAIYPLGSDAVWSVGINQLQFFFPFPKGNKRVKILKKGLVVFCVDFHALQKGCGL
jgi:hypothetical protein